MKGEAPKLSLLIPAYNRPEMLCETLRSLASVTVPCEIVVVDDASPIDLTETVTREAKRDPRIRFIRNERNVGATRNFNHAFEQARGAYMCILGDDDTSLPGNFEKKTAILDAHPEVGLIYSGHYYTDAANRPTGVAQWPGMLPYSYVGGRDEFIDLLPWNYISLHATVYRRELFEQYGGFDDRITECGNDWELNLRYCYHTQTAYINEPLLNVRVHEAAATRTSGLLQGKLAAGRIEVWRKWLVDRDPPIVLHERTWETIQQLYVRDLNFWFKQDEASVQHWLRQFRQLQQDHLTSVQRRVEVIGATLSPAAAGEGTTPGSASARSASGQPSRVRVVWEGGFFETHSLALVNRELALAALRGGEVDMSLRLRQLESVKFDPHHDPRLSPLLRRVDSPLDGEPDVHVRHAWPPVFEKPRAGKWVMVQPWEYGRLPIEWVGPMRDDVTEIWAYSQAVKNAYVDSGVPAEKVHVIPLGIDPVCFRPGVPPLALPTARSFRFLFVGGTIWRKGIDVLLEAYRRSFTRKDDVCLVIKDIGQDSYYKGQGSGETITRLQADPEAPEIVYATGALADKDMATLYSACHCLVHPYRGEGFGLPVAEAMACGLAVMVTQGGACDDFCAEDRAYLIPSTRQPMNMSVPTAGQAWILEPDVEALAGLMRAAFEAQDETAERGKRARRWVREHLTWEVSASKAVARLKALAAPAAASVRVDTAASPAEQAFEEGKAHLNGERWPAAEAALRRAIEINPRMGGAHYLLGCCYLQQDRAAEALAEIEAALAMRDDVADFWNARGCALRELGQVTGAREAFRRALALDPANADAQANLSELTEAVQGTALAASPENPIPSPGTPSQAPGYYGHPRPEVVELIPGDARRVLDVGCAGGAMGALIKQRLGAEVVGIEAVKHVAEMAAQHLDRVLVEDLERVHDLPFDNGYFDCIVFADVLEHLADPARLLELMRRYLSPSGTIVCSFPNVGNWATLLDLVVNGRWTYQDEGILDRTHLRFFTAEELQRLMARTGFRVEAIGGSRLREFERITDVAEVVAELGGDAERLRSETVAFQYIFRARPADASPLPDGEPTAPKGARADAALGKLLPAAAVRILDIGRNVAHRSSGSRSRREITTVRLGDTFDLDGDEALPFAPGQFDCIVLGDALARVRKPEAALRNLKPCLTEGGSVVLSIPNARHLPLIEDLLVHGRWRYRAGGQPDVAHLKFFTRAEIEPLLASAGFLADDVASGAASPAGTALGPIARLVGQLGGDVDRFRDEARVARYLVSARPVA